MRRKLKEFFDKAARLLRRQTVAAAATTTLSFGAAGAVTTVPLAAAATTTTAIVQPVDRNANPDIDTDTLYWKHKDYDIIVRSQPTANNGLSLTIDYINIHDPNNRELMAQLKGYYRAEKVTRPGIRGPSHTTRYVPDVDRVRDWEMLAYVGYSVNVNLKQASDNKWRGTIRSPFNWQSYGLDVKQLDDDTVKVSGYFTSFPLFKLSEKATRVDNPPQQPPYNWRSPSIA